MTSNALLPEDGTSYAEFYMLPNISLYSPMDVDNLPWDYYNGNYTPGICGDISEHRDYTQLTGIRFLITAVYCVVVFLAVTGNSLVIWTVWRNNHMHTVTNYYIVNLAISDLLVSAIVMPLKLLEYTAPCEWHVFNSDALCSVLNYFLPIFVFVSVLTLVAISLERYYAIVHPLSAMKINSKSRTRKILAVTWIIPIILASPYTYCSSYGFVLESDLGRISRQICMDRFDEIDVAMYGTDALGTGRFRRGFFIFLFLAVYLIPMILILTTCVKIAICLLRPISIKRTSQGQKEHSRRHEENKRKVARMVIVIAVAFIVAWSPQYIVSIASQLQSLHGDANFLQERQFIFTMLMTHLCGFLNSCINPFIYTIMSRKFRKSFRYIFSRVFCCCLRRRAFRYQTSLTHHQSAAHSSVGKQSVTELKDANEFRVSEGASSGGDSSGSHQGRSTQKSYKDSSQALLGPRADNNKKWATSNKKRYNKGSFMALKCLKTQEDRPKFKNGDVIKNYAVSSTSVLCDKTHDVSNTDHIDQPGDMDRIEALDESNMDHHIEISNKLSCTVYLDPKSTSKHGNGKQNGFESYSLNETQA